MIDSFDPNLEEWKSIIKIDQFCCQTGIKIIEEFCTRNKLNGINGISGILHYVKKLNLSDPAIKKENISLLRSFGETAYLLWCLEKTGNIKYADAIANEFRHGGDYGDTQAYLTEHGTNFFRSFELQLNIALRLIETKAEFKTGNEGPDYIITSPYSFSIKVKSPSTQKSLVLNTIKAIQQINKMKLPGIVVLSLDHMIATNSLSRSEKLISDPDYTIITSMLALQKFGIIGIVAEWMNWNEPDDKYVIVYARNEIKGTKNDKILHYVKKLAVD